MAGGGFSYYTICDRAFKSWLFHKTLLKFTQASSIEAMELDHSSSAMQHDEAEFSKTHIQNLEIDPEDIDPNDELLYTMPIFFSQQLSPYLHLFQYPVRTMPFVPNNGPIAARVKPKAQMIEVDLPLNVDGPTYNHEKGFKFAENTNEEEIKPVLTEGKMRSTGTTNETKKNYLDKQTLTSLVVPPQTNYYIGVIKDNELHLTGVQRTVQLRPSLGYIDKMDEKEKQRKKISEEEDRDDKEKRKAETEKKTSAVQLSVKAGNPDQIPRKNIYSSLHRFAEDEAWTKLSYYDEISNESNVIYERMFAAERQELVCKTKMSDYLNMISARTLQNKT